MQRDIHNCYYEDGTIMANPYPEKELVNVCPDSIPFRTLTYSHNSYRRSYESDRLNALYPIALSDITSSTCILYQNIATYEYNYSDGQQSGFIARFKEGDRFDMNGYNTIYNQYGDIWMLGLFKNGQLWDGKLYKFDEDLLICKIEIWKDGNYHSDGQL